jgi:hypothetical protein
MGVMLERCLHTRNKEWTPFCGILNIIHACNYWWACMQATANLIIIDVRYQLSTVFRTSLLPENRWNHDNGRQLLWEWQYGSGLDNSDCKRSWTTEWQHTNTGSTTLSQTFHHSKRVICAQISCINAIDSDTHKDVNDVRFLNVSEKRVSSLVSVSVLQGMQLNICK